MRKPAANTDLIAQGSLLKLGRLLAVGDVLIYPQGQTQPVARASMTYALPKD
jgi:acyl-coenzyme A thioesterase PaaI-like protein